MIPSPLNVVVFQECDVWVAHCVEVDICVQAPDRKALERRLVTTIQLEWQESLQRHGVPFGGIDAAPQNIKDMWVAAKDGATIVSGSVEVNHNSSTTVDYRMALAA